METGIVGNGCKTHTEMSFRRAGPERTILWSSLVTGLQGTKLKVPISPIGRPGTIKPPESSASDSVHVGDDHDEETYVFCALCCKWYTELYWKGMPRTPFGICPICRCNLLRRTMSSGNPGKKGLPHQELF
ncbi:hypothetical protein R1flu_001325 [Riccia fluitans]|uniref:Uncharacterized protein n=1 Tax=Riccia fluitans TaxID=41844 RepID=A0ABD1Y2Z0_9MARC